MDSPKPPREIGWVGKAQPVSDLGHGYLGKGQQAACLLDDMCLDIGRGGQSVCGAAQTAKVSRAQSHFSGVFLYTPSGGLRIADQAIKARKSAIPFGASAALGVGVQGGGH